MDNILHLMRNTCFSIKVSVNIFNKNKYFSNKLIYQEDVFIELFGNFIKQSVFFETKAPFHFLKR